MFVAGITWRSVPVFVGTAGNENVEQRFHLDGECFHALIVDAPATSDGMAM